MPSYLWRCQGCKFCCECSWPVSVRIISGLSRCLFGFVGIYDGGNFNRELATKLFVETNLKPSKGMESIVEFKDFTIAGIQEEDARIKCRLATSKVEVVGESRPLVLHIHGGGWTIGSAASEDSKIISEVMTKAGFHVLSCNYRLAPENPFPAAVLDVYHVLRWLMTPEAKEKLPNDVDLSKLILSGDSAGGNLALVMGQLLNDGVNAELNPESLDISVAHIIMYYPALNLAPSYPSIEAPKSQAMINKKIMDFFVKSYAGENKNVYQDSRFSPLVGNLTNLPPMTCVVGTRDRLYNHSLELDKQVKKVGGQITLIEVPNLPHAFLAFRDIPSNKTTFSETLRTLGDLVPAVRSTKGSPEQVKDMKR